MTKYLVATGLAIAVATTFSYAQTPPSTDRPSGVEEGGASSKSDMDKKKGSMNKSAPKSGATSPPPSTDSPSGVEEGGASAKPKPDKK